MSVATPPRRRRRRRLIVALALLVCAVLGTLFGVASTYQPLNGNSTIGSLFSTLGGRPLVDRQSFGQDYWIATSPKFKAQLQFSIYNSGPWAVTIERVGIADLPTAGSSVVRRLVNVVKDGIVDTVPGPVIRGPLSIAPSQEIGFQLSATFHCRSPEVIDAFSSYSNLVVRYDFLGLSHTVSLETGGGFNISGPTMCPYHEG